MFKFCNELTFFQVSTHVLILQVYITTRILLVTDLQKPNPFLGWFHCEGRNVEASDSTHEITSPPHCVTLKLERKQRFELHIKTYCLVGFELHLYIP